MMNLNNMSAGSRRAVPTLLLSGLLLAPLARAQVIPFVDHYQTNVSANTTPETNAALALLSGYSLLWTTGATWNTGAPTTFGAPVLRANEDTVVDVTVDRTAAQEESAYFTDRRNQSYTAINGLGALAEAYRVAAGATTTINTVEVDANIAKYNDVGTGGGVTTSSTVGNIVALVITLRGNYSSTTPAKNYFDSPRPWRVNDDFLVVPLGTESTGYYTTDLSDGTPNYAAGLTYFPLYETHDVVPPVLMAVRSTTPASDGGFVSGHTNAGYLASFAMGYAMPAYLQSLLVNGSQIGQDRLVAGMHSPLDVIGGRMLSTALAASILSDPANAALKAAAYTQGQAFLAANGTTVQPLDAAAHRKDKQLYRFRMTYGLPATGPCDVPAVVPKGAEVLLETRQPYLEAAQRREVLRTTAIDSGHVVADDAEGWGRLDLYAAVDGYGAFDSDVVVNMDSSAGGFAAKDAWRNDIDGSGKLTKQGTGELDLTGENRYSGGTELDDGILVAASRSALGRGPVVVTGGTLVDSSEGVLHIGGDYSQTAGGTLELTVGKSAVAVDGNVRLAGQLRINLAGSRSMKGSIPILWFKGGRAGSFDQVVVTGGAGSAYSLSYGPNFILLNLR
jgi:autotransporter-associated beta strand protein